MVRRHYNFPPLSALAAFEAAARHQSFKLGADDLNVTPAAISHQVKTLESDLGVQLFLRVHRGVVLTEAGTELFKTLRRSFLEISDTLDRLRDTSRTAAVTISATTAMSALWLTPAISQLWRSNPEIRIDQLVSDARDLGHALPDLRITYGPPEDSVVHVTPLFHDVLVPLCGTRHMHQFQAKTIHELAELPLIHLDIPDQNWTSWERWFSEAGYMGRQRRGIRVNNYMIALQAAEDGAGLVLGWKKLTSRMIRQGSVSVVGGFEVPAPTSFFLSRYAGASASDGVALLEDHLSSFDISDAL